jgi:2'-5' RNA ligase
MQDLFFVAILPPSVISNDIDEIRKQCALEYQVYSALKPPVHITLIPPFKLDPMREQKLIASLEQSRNFIPFKQELRDYDGFPPKVVFINAIKNSGITGLHKILKKNLKTYTKESTGSINPHITIAYRDVTPTIYDQIMEAYNKRHFQTHFTVDKFALLKHDGKKWNLFKEFESRPIQENQYKMDF